jgi:hypothetical protein
VPLLLLGSTSAALLLVEALLRVFLPQPLTFDTAALWEPAPGVGWLRRSNLDTRVNTGEREVRVLSDAFRHRVGPTPERSDGHRLLAIGDSMVEALQVDYEQTMTTLLARSLAKRLRRSVEVVNGGLGGWDPNHYLIAAKRELELASYDLLLVFVYLENDLVERRVDSFPPTTRLSPPPGALGARARAFLRQTSHLFVFSQNLRELARIRSGRRPRHLLANVMRANSGSPAWTVTAEILADIAAAAAARGTGVLFVLLPPDQYFDESALARYARAVGVGMAELDVGQPARLLTTELTRRGLQVADPAPALRAAFVAGERDLYGRVDKHFAPAGHQVVARFLEGIVQIRLTPPP